MGSLFDVLFYVTDAMQFGDAANGYLSKLPADVQPHAQYVVERILAVMGW